MEPYEKMHLIMQAFAQTAAQAEKDLELYDYTA
jgi:hypothetical protein